MWLIPLNQIFTAIYFYTHLHTPDYIKTGCSFYKLTVPDYSLLLHIVTTGEICHEQGKWTFVGWK